MFEIVWQACFFTCVTNVAVFNPYRHNTSYTSSFIPPLSPIVYIWPQIYQFLAKDVTDYCDQ